jgi:hypothetical protein
VWDRPLVLAESECAALIVKSTKYHERGVLQIIVHSECIAKVAALMHPINAAASNWSGTAAIGGVVSGLQSLAHQLIQMCHSFQR